MNLLNFVGCEKQNVHFHKLELNLSDLVFMYISEINFPKKKHIKISVKQSRFVSSIKQTHFLHFQALLFKSLEGG